MAKIVESLQVVRENIRVYLFLNIFFYGLLVLTVIYASQHPEMQKSIFYAAQAGIQKGPLSSIYQIYHVERNIPLAAIVTFVVNLVAGAGLMLSLPSCIIPFAGLPILAYRFILWGLIFGPDRVLLAAPAGTLLLEGQGYILVALGIYVQGMRFLRPRRYGLQSYTEGYKAGFKLSAKLYVLVALVLLVAALFESIVGISTSKPLFPKTGGSYSQLVGDKQQIDFSGSTMFYDSTNAEAADAKTAGLLLEEIGYFRMGDTTSARISRDGSLFTIEVRLPASFWENEKVRDRFTFIFKRLGEVFPNRTYQFTALSLDDSGTVSKKTFRLPATNKPTEQPGISE